MSKFSKVLKQSVGITLGVTIGFAVGGIGGAIIGAELGNKAAGGKSSLIGKGLETIGGAIGGSIGNEIKRWGEDYTQVIKVVTGEYHDDVKNIEEFQKSVGRRGEMLDQSVKQYNMTIDEFVDKMERLVAFHEIFQMAIGNNLTRYQELYGPGLDANAAEYNRLVQELNKMIIQLKSEYDFVIGLTEGAFIQRIVGSLLMIAGGIMSDMGDILSGKADSATWKRIITIVVLVIVIVFMWWNPLGWSAAAVAVSIALAALNAFITLDGMYANGAGTGAIMGLLDFIFNDILNLDDLIGSDFDKFDKNHEDYQQMVGYVQLAIALAQIYVGFTAGGPFAPTGYNNPATGMTEFVSTEAGMVGTDTMAGQIATGEASGSYLGGAIQTGGTMETTSFLGMSFNTYSQLFKAYSTAQQVGDIIAANKLYEDTKDKMKSDLDKLNTAISSKLDKNMMKHYKDSAYFLQDQQANIDSYVWSMTSENMYVDPYGTTPVANIRFTPDKDTRVLSFGFEDVFDENTMAGSRGYFNNIIYGS